jgi:hypothetical protein
MSYYLIQIFDKNVEKISYLFDNVLKIREKDLNIVMFYIGVFGVLISGLFNVPWDFAPPISGGVKEK